MVSEILPTILEFAEEARASTFGTRASPSTLITVLLSPHAALSIRNINAMSMKSKTTTLRHESVSQSNNSGYSDYACSH
jgi:hypothetical protein